MAPTEQDIYSTLNLIIDPISESGIVDAGLVSSLVIKKNHIGLALELKGHNQQQAEQMQNQVQQTLSSLNKNIEKVTVALTGDMAKSAPDAPAKKNLTANLRAPIPGIKKIIAVGSGKGGVGKSTMTVLLALAYEKAGYKVGIADADIYGPSIAHLLGFKGRHEVEGNQLIPFKIQAESSNLVAASMGALTDENISVVWRGPMITKALYQMLRTTKWPELDILFIDLPPGTGDIPLHLSQNYPLTGVILVSTPQELAVLDVKKAADMFNKLNVPVLGVIENMAYLEDHLTGQRNYIFGSGNVERWAGISGVKLAGSLPIISQLSKNFVEVGGESYKENILKEMAKILSNIDISQ